MTERRGMYPPIEPYASGHLDTGDGHQLYWERCGTPGAKPAVFLHGGPGAGCSPDQRRQFDPSRYDVLLFDQRGCGRSRPSGSLEANTTWDLVEDMERLRRMAGVDRWMVFGGSWGSTLALAYSQTHPERVTELVVRGIFTFRRSEVDWLFRFGASEIFPDKWERFTAFVPESERGDLVAAYHARITGGDPAVRLAASQAWIGWEAETLSLLPDPGRIAELTAEHRVVAAAGVMIHYMANMGWLEEGQLIANAGRLAGIPGVIIQGRYDICTPPAAAWDLHRAWPEAEITIVPDGGHLFTEPGILDGLVGAADRFAGAPR